MSSINVTNIKHPSSASNNIVLDSSGGVDMDAFTVDGSAPADSVNLDASGRLLVGTSTSLGGYASKLQVASTSDDQATFARYTTSSSPGILALQRSGSGTLGTNAIVQNGDNLFSINFLGADGTNYLNAASITAAVDGTPGANDMPGRLVFSTTADGASSPTERMRITSGGDILISKTGSSNTFPGVQLMDNGQGWFTVDSDYCAIFNRETNDGVIIYLQGDGANEGSISVSGTTVTYGGGHLARWSQLPNDEDPSSILKGTVMSNLDEMCEWGEEDNEQLNKTKVSDIEGDPNVAGVFVSTSFDDEGPLDFYVGMTGDMIIRIAENVTVQRGDLLMSAGDGTAKPQDDDIIRSKTVAKVTSTHVTCTYEDGSYCVPCVLMAC